MPALLRSNTAVPLEFWMYLNYLYFTFIHFTYLHFIKIILRSDVLMLVSITRLSSWSLNYVAGSYKQTDPTAWRTYSVNRLDLVQSAAETQWSPESSGSVVFCSEMHEMFPIHCFSSFVVVFYIKKPNGINRVINVYIFIILTRL